MIAKNLSFVTRLVINKQKNNTRPLWTNAGPKGKDDLNHSMKHLIDQLTTGDNWIKYKGKNNNGKSKSQFAKEIASFINSTGVKETRTAEQVRVKIDAIEKAYKIADNFVNNTGVGLKEDDPDNFEDVVRNSFFSYYFNSKPIFRDHASISPVMTNKDLMNESCGAEESGVIEAHTSSRTWLSDSEIGCWFNRRVHWRWQSQIVVKCPEFG